MQKDIIREPKLAEVETFQQELVVKFSYQVSFTHGLFDIDNSLLAETVRKGSSGRVPARVLVYIDDGVSEAHPHLIQRIRNYFSSYSDLLELADEPMTTPGGEQAKNGWNTIRNIMTHIANCHLDRHSYVIVVGGGSVLDGVGFAASIVHRGVRLIRVPTTVLAQNDAGVGVKTGMDEHGIKNFVGTFAPPFAVLSDFDFLPTLKDKYWFGGIAEAFKVAIIKDRSFFEYMECNSGVLRVRDSAAIAEVIKRTAKLHLDHIRDGGDPFESGAARPLDFGHWAAHKIEVLSNYRLGHGQAVAVGIALDSFYAAHVGLLSFDEAGRIALAMQSVGLSVWDLTLDMRDDRGRLLILDGLDEFREHLGGELTITLPDGIGQRVEVHEMQHDLILKAIDCLRGGV